MAGKEDETMGWSAWLGKRPRDSSSINEEDEPQVRRARSQEEQPENHATASTDTAAAAELSPSSSWPLNHNNNVERRSRPMAERLTDYLAETSKYSPRPEWYRPWVGRKRPREASPPPNNTAPSRAEAVLPPPVAAAAAEAQRQGRLEAPADGLLPDDAFVSFLQQQQIIPSPPPPANDAVWDLDFLNTVEEQEEAKSSEEAVQPTVLEPRLATFGRVCDTALHMACREGANEAALELMHLGASVHAENAKGGTPLILAAQRGSLEIVKELWSRGAALHQSSHTGSTAIIQASHFGHLHIVEFLVEKGASIEKANNHNTTPLMRASQEGHNEIVSLFIKNGAEVNRRNNAQMSALMLASQRGHASIVQLLIDSGAMIDATTQQESTSLMLACKRGHVNVVRVLVTSGCEIWIRDSRRRTAKDMAMRRNVKELVQLLDPDVQVDLMRRKARVERNHAMIQTYMLLQQERAQVQFMHKNVSIHQVHTDLLINKGGLSALIRTMTLPAPLVELVASFLPLPRLWDKRSALIVKRCTVDPDQAIASSLEIIDEVLDEGGFVDACDEAQVTPPTNFSSWCEWKIWGHSFKKERDSDSSASATDVAAARPMRQSITHATLPGLPRFIDPSSAASPADAAGVPESPKESYVQMRRGICFLQLLAHRTTMLGRILSSPPYNMPASLIQQLITVSDIQSLSRRMGSQGVHFEAIEMLMLVNTVCAWYNGVRCDEQDVVGSPAQYWVYASTDSDSPAS